MMDLENVKVGDDVFIGAFDGGWRLVKIVRATATQLTPEGSTDRYMRRSGRRVGDGEWSRHGMRGATPEMRAQVERKKAHDAVFRRLADARGALARLAVTEANVERVEAFLASLKEQQA